MKEDYVRWCDAYEHIKHGGMAQHKSWNPNCRIKLNNLGEIVFEDGSECWLEFDELVDDQWLLLPYNNVHESFEDYPELAKTLTINLLTTKLWYEKGKLHRNLYDFYQERGSLSVLKGGWCVSYHDEVGFMLDLSTTFNPLTIYTTDMSHAKEAYSQYIAQFERIVHIERGLTQVKAGAFDTQELQAIYLKYKDMK